MLVKLPTRSLDVGTRDQALSRIQPVAVQLEARENRNRRSVGDWREDKFQADASVQACRVEFSTVP